MPVPLRTRFLDPQIITAHPGFEIVRLQLRTGVQLANAQSMEDVIELVESVIAWLAQTVLVDEGLSKGQPQSAIVYPVTSYGLVTDLSGVLLRYPDGRHDLPGVFSGRERRDAIRMCLAIMRARGYV